MSAASISARASRCKLSRWRWVPASTSGRSQSLVMTPQLQQAISCWRCPTSRSRASSPRRSRRIRCSRRRRRGRARGRAEPSAGRGATATARPSTLDADRRCRRAATRARHRSRQRGSPPGQRRRRDARAGRRPRPGGSAAAAAARTGRISTASRGDGVVAARPSARPGRRGAVAARDLIIAEQIIEQIDETGYLHGRLLESPSGSACRWPRSSGAGGRPDLRSGRRRRAQPRRMPRAPGEGGRPLRSGMARLIDNLDLLAKGNLAALKRICGVDDEDIADMIRELRGYDPKPGLRFGARSGSRRSCPTSSSPAAAAAGRSSSTARRCRALLVNRVYYHRAVARARRTSSPRPGSPNACRAPTG